MNPRIRLQGATKTKPQAHRTGITGSQSRIKHTLIYFPNVAAVPCIVGLVESGAWILRAAPPSWVPKSSARDARWCPKFPAHDASACCTNFKMAEEEGVLCLHCGVDLARYNSRGRSIRVGRCRAKQERIAAAARAATREEEARSSPEPPAKQAR